MDKRKFNRSNRGRVLFGVCAGLGEYMQIDPNIVRIAWVAFSILVPGGILLYLVTPLFIPSGMPDDEPVAPLLARNHLLAFLFIGIGLILLITQYQFWNARWFNLIEIPLGAFLAIIFIITGLLVFFFGSVRRDPMFFAIEGEKRLLRSNSERKLLGVCGGIADYFNADVSLVRLFFIAGTLVSIWLGIIMYIILALLMPVKPEELAEDDNEETESDRG